MQPCCVGRARAGDQVIDFPRCAEGSTAAWVGRVQARVGHDLLRPAFPALLPEHDRQDSAPSEWACNLWVLGSLGKRRLQTSGRCEAAPCKAIFDLEII